MVWNQQKDYAPFMRPADCMTHVHGRTTSWALTIKASLPLKERAYGYTTYTHVPLLVDCLIVLTLHSGEAEVRIPSCTRIGLWHDAIYLPALCAEPNTSSAYSHSRTTIPLMLPTPRLFLPSHSVQRRPVQWATPPLPSRNSVQMLTEQPIWLPRTSLDAVYPSYLSQCASGLVIA
jgi:hypothetical protein